MTTINGENGHSDVEIQATILSGPAEGKRHKFRRCTAINYGNAATHAELGGTQMGPVDIVAGSASPTWDMEISRREMVEFITLMGDGYMRCKFELTIGFRPVGGLARQVDEVEGCMLEDDGIKSSRGDSVMCAPKGKCVKVKPNGIDPFGDDEA